MATENNETSCLPKLPPVHRGAEPGSLFDLSSYKRSRGPSLGPCVSATKSSGGCRKSMPRSSKGSDPKTKMAATSETPDQGRVTELPRNVPRTAHVSQVPCQHAELLEHCRPLRPAPDILPIPPMPVSERYPYRYTSAKPSSFYRMLETKEIKRCLRVSKKASGLKDPMDLRFVVQKPGFETTSMTDALHVYHFFDPKELPAAHIPQSLLTPLYSSFEPTSEFDRYLLNELYPDWQTNRKYKRSILYWVKADP